MNDGSLVLLENTIAARVFISIDVNGYNKNPNRLGHDLFMFQIDDKGKLLPMGASGTAYYSTIDDFCSPTSTEQHERCRLHLQGFLQIKDYFKNLPK